MKTKLNYETSVKIDLEIKEEFDISPITEIIEDLRLGKMVIIVDEENRENEGDLMMAADFITPEAINFMVTHARGLVCLTLTHERCDELGLPMMTSNNRSGFGTNFTTSIEAAEGVTTGISAADRAHTVKVAISKNSKPTDLVQPGHIFPVRSVPGGVLIRAGHTEAGCDLTKLAGLTPASVICEIMNTDGTMSRLPDLMEFAKHHGIKIGTIVDLIQYRNEHESMIERIGECELATSWGMFKAYAYKDKSFGSPHIALVKGDIEEGLETLVRVHEPTNVLDLLDMEGQSHSWSLPKAIEKISKSDRGVIVLLNAQGNEGGLMNSLAKWGRSEAEDETKSKATKSEHYDMRTYGIGAQILRDLGVGKMKLLSHPLRLPSMTGFSLEVTGYEQA
ncbi:bifunctional 3,4-dihydroxy-2-butanone-4-phosphate synthase/GTP cyclohydrolase II [Taylorella equigenitalis]|uniref:bifunctional 3,4-dihydroxy-2-butanone-4-phosphate synthase/GTP cyclohydrolase II n=1 Tax=Taylorella equigenitalis TaxID=29575 RepID=UPI00237C9AA7|nr:bifunctional 3,4-dihydroxy-2-butanone-4-phosphate synthase/GTP cyclohydrolase II [Taylorella equigenitalis]WDU55180.1 3,4-dihydroxy-2-butanone-4-phosphate synthase [Taylorella equigenitalis]